MERATGGPRGVRGEQARRAATAAVLNEQKAERYRRWLESLDLRQREAIADGRWVDGWRSAEKSMLKAMKGLGFADVRRTASGADSGIDLESRGAVAQLKYWPSQKVGRPVAQQLCGAAGHKRALLFAFGAKPYSNHAMEWASEHGVALFAFDLCGVVVPVTQYARNLYGGTARDEELMFAPSSQTRPDAPVPVVQQATLPRIKPLDGGPPGEYQDPYHRHEWRWWDGESWTALVRDGDLDSKDEPDWPWS